MGQKKKYCFCFKQNILDIIHIVVKKDALYRKMQRKLKNLENHSIHKISHGSLKKVLSDDITNLS